MQEYNLKITFPRWWALSFLTRPCTTEIRESPTKPSGKGSKRKQDELDEEDYIEEEEEAQGEEVEEEDSRQTWVEALNQELNDEDDGPEVDPDYEVGDLLFTLQAAALGCCSDGQYNVTSHPRLHLRTSLNIFSLVDVLTQAATCN